MGWSKNHGKSAKVNADYAKEQGNVAKQEASNLSQLKSDVEVATLNASTATENANAVIEDANTAASNADSAASEAIAQANHAKNEGNRAKAEADRLVGTDVSVLDNKIQQVTTQLAQTARQTQTLQHGLNVINGTAGSSLDVEFFGRTLINILGKQGEMTADSDANGVADGWTRGSAVNAVYQVTPHGQLLQGQYSVNRITKDITTLKGKYILLVISYKKISGVTNYLEILDGENSLRTISNGIENEYKTAFIKFIPSSTTLGISASLNGVTQRGSIIKNLSLYEVDKSIYDKIGVLLNDTEMEKMFPYVEGVQHLKRPYLKIANKYLYADVTLGQIGAQKDTLKKVDSKWQLNKVVDTEASIPALLPVPQIVDVTDKIQGDLSINGSTQVEVGSGFSYQDIDGKRTYTLTPSTQRYNQTVNATEIIATYANNIRSALDDTVKKVVDNTTMLSVHEKAIVDLYVKVKALGGI